jgi:phosphate-selective porin OprO/OprP
MAGGSIAARAQTARAQQDSTPPSVDERLRPKVSAGQEGFWLRSADGAFALHVGGYIQADSRSFIGDSAVPLTNVFLLRRIRPLFEGTVFKYFDFRILPDWGGSTAVIQDAYVVARASQGFRLQAGKFKGPVGLERLQSAQDILFVERAFPTAIAANRELGFELTGDLGGGLVHYDAGIFDGAVDGGSVDTDTGDNKDGEGRLYFTPFIGSGIGFLEGLSLGAGGTIGREHGTATASALASYRTPGQNVFFSYRSNGTAAGTAVANGRRWRVSPQAYWHVGPLGLLGEWIKSSQLVTRGATTATIGSTAWQTVGSFALTGEAASFTGIKPKRPVDQKGGIGAVELVARYSELEVGDEAFPAFADRTKSAQKAKEWAVGLNWYPERRIKIAVNYGQTSFEGGAATGNREDEKALLTRFQVAF